MEVYLESNGFGIISKDLFDDRSLSPASGHEQKRVIHVLDNWVVHLPVAWEREMYQSSPVSIIDSRLQKISGKNEDEG